MDVFVLKGDVVSSWTDDEFLKFCIENQDLRIERNSNLEIIIRPLLGTLSGFYSGEVSGQLSNWNTENKKGIAFGSLTGFTLPDRSVLSSNASWMSMEKWNALTEEDKDRFAPVCPDFVIEVRSKSDRIEDLLKKMKVWIKNGASQAWLIDPQEKVSYLFNVNGNEKKLEGFNRKITGQGLVQGFELDLSLLKV
jgi:Uma2 family endonuclease